MMDWYPWNPTHYRRDTLHLSLAEDGAYRRLIDESMMLEGPLPDDDLALARILGVSLDDWLAVAPKVRPFFRSKEGKLFNKRCVEELDVQKRRYERFSQRGKKAAFAKYSKTNGKGARRMLIPPTVQYIGTSLTSSESVTEPKEASELEKLIRTKGWGKP